MPGIASVAVFLGSSPGRSPVYRVAAEAFADELVRRRVRLVFGGSGRGIMGALADRVVAGGGVVTGVIPAPMVSNRWHHDALDDLRVVDSMHERKVAMYELADAVVALPGGLGTLDEFVEALTWVQLGIHAKPVGLLSVDGFFDPLLAMFERAVEEGFLPAWIRECYRVAEDPTRLLDELERMPPPRRAYRWPDPRRAD